MEKLQALWKQPDTMSREEIGEAIELLQRAIRVGEHTLGDIENQARDLIETRKLELARTTRDAKRITIEQTIAEKRALERATAEWVDKLDQDPLPEVPLPESPLPDVPAPEVPTQLDEDRQKKRLLNFTGDLTLSNAPAGIVQGEIAPTQSLADVQPLPRTTDSANNATTFTFRGPPNLQRFFEDGWAIAAEQYSRPSTPLTIYQEVEVKSPGACPESPDTREPRLRHSKRGLPAAAADVSVPVDAPSRDPQEVITPSDISPNTQPVRKATDMADDPTTQMWLEVMSLDKQITKLQEEMFESSSLRIRKSRHTRLHGVTRNDTRLIIILREDAKWSFERIHAYCKERYNPNITMGQLEYICSEFFPDPFEKYTI